MICGVPGGPGRTSGRATAEGVDAGESPTSLCATTWNVYSVPLVRPVTVHEVDAHSSVADPPLAAVTVYPVIGAPLSSPAVNTSSTVPSPTSPTRGAEGASGFPRTVTRISPLTSRSGSPVASWIVYDAVRIPANSGSGVIST